MTWSTARIHLGHAFGLPAPRRDAKDRRGDARREQDDAVGVPCATAGILRVGDDERRAAGDIGTFQLVAREESKGPAVRRPEWEAGAFGARQHAVLDRIERADPEHRPAILVGDKRELRAVWR